MEIIKTVLKIVLGIGRVSSYSQFGEDAVLESLFRKQRRGIYVDVGAYHPVQYSNTYLFSRKGWRGVVVEPNVRMRGLYALFRPRDRFVCAALGQEHRTRTYYEYKDGAYNTLDADQVERTALKNHVRPVRTREVPVLPLANIVQEQGLTIIDLLSVDAEGMDMEILQSHDWSVRPTAICIEAHGFDMVCPSENELYRYLKSKGYDLVGKAGLSLIFKDAHK